MAKDDKNNIITVDPSGKLFWRGKEYRCALGNGGVRADKHEGDGATPAGCFPLRKVLYRADRIPKPKTKLSVRALANNDGWCDETNDPAYNKSVVLPFLKSHEALWRDDHVYDLIVVVGYNDDPPIPGKGSAIFMHVAREGYSATAGCVALAKDDLLEILKTVTETALLCIRSEQL
jgi:L,D-peptidoglycan transpeptidase YkuD (ErfK/YbiS/YcfS/YnhG family)